MLEQLSIQNFAIIENWNISFDAGESAVTGETGSGKSLFVDSLLFLSGDKIDRSVRRDTDAVTSVEGLFYIDQHLDLIRNILEKSGIEIDDYYISIRRELNQRGTKAYINNKFVTQHLLKDVFSYLLDIHSQNAQSLLSDKKSYVKFLDQIIQDETDEEKNKIRETLSILKDIKNKWDSIDISPEDLQREKDLLEYQINEIENANLEDINEEELNIEYKKLTNAADRLDLANRLIDAYSNRGDSIRSYLQSISREFDNLYRLDKSTEEIKDLSWQMDAEAEAIQNDLERYRDNIILDPKRISEIDQVFDSLQRCRRKYGQSISDILEYKNECISKLEKLNNIDDERNKLIIDRDKYSKNLSSYANTLTNLRITAADLLKEKIKKELKEMSIKNISFDIEIKNSDKITESGKDIVDFLISTNKGEKMHSVSEVASGGEMSRFMLAFKIIISNLDKIPTLIFDEIDTGISGRTAQVVAEKLNILSKNHQLIVITHLPQIAALADEDYLISKKVLDDRTLSLMSKLNMDERIDEQARLIGGINITDITKKSAQEMLEQAANFKNSI